MTEGLHHPPHVARALDRFDRLVGMDDILASVGCSNRASPSYLPMEVLVRLLRRGQIDPQPKLERAVLASLVRRIDQWVKQNYSGLAQDLRPDMSQELLTRLVREIARRTTIDWWEINIHVKLERAAADFYHDLFVLPPGTTTLDIVGNEDVHNDKGFTAAEILANVQDLGLDGRLAEILTPAEMQVVYPLFLSPVPLCSKKGSVDLVRTLGKKEGTLREMKTRIKEKLTAALTERPL